MSLGKIYCDGCGRGPSFWEWAKGELTTGGYGEWRHPGIAFQSAGCPITYNTRAKAEYLFEALFNRVMPEELGYLCPHCQEYVAAELPALSAGYTGESHRPTPRHW
jgi:hypothetical protein